MHNPNQDDKTTMAIFRKLLLGGLILTATLIVLGLIVGEVIT